MIRTLTAVTLVLFTAGAAWAQNASVTTDAISTSAGKSSSASASESATPAKPFVYKPNEYDVVEGKDSAPVTVVEYASLSCPHCAHFYTQAFPALKTKYIDTGKVKFVYRNYPLNDPALKGAQLVACADPDRRHAFLKVLFTTQQKWAYDAGYRKNLSDIAVLGGIDRLAFESCMNDRALEKKITAIAKEAADDYKVNSTPNFFINQNMYKGDHDAASLGKAIDDAIAKGQAK